MPDVVNRYRKSIDMSDISNGNRTEWSPIRSVIIRVINKIGQPCSGSPICLITSILGSFFNQNTRNSEIFLLAVKKKPFKRARDGAYCPIT